MRYENIKMTMPLANRNITWSQVSKLTTNHFLFLDTPKPNGPPTTSKPSTWKKPHCHKSKPRSLTLMTKLKPRNHWKCHPAIAPYFGLN